MTASKRTHALVSGICLLLLAQQAMSHTWGHHRPSFRKPYERYGHSVRSSSRGDGWRKGTPPPGGRHRRAGRSRSLASQRGVPGRRLLGGRPWARPRSPRQ
ncbi:uncharacterized protein LOC134775493 [Penaeus indicus]|uniref:uncharacterized protein LOC134775493 n=1 Tax=Penaeus indicus TaxID=29960 RepID=UPI00300C35D7